MCVRRVRMMWMVRMMRVRKMRVVRVVVMDRRMLMRIVRVVSVRWWIMLMGLVCVACALQDAAMRW